MGPSRRGEARRRHGRRLLLLALAGIGAIQATGVSVADQPTVEPAETASGYAWQPSSLTAAPGGTVAFRNPGNVVPHGVHWTGGPEKPTCSGVPVDEFGTSWSGTCSFAQAGTYTFVCTVHPEEMNGTITVAAGETPASPPPGSGQPPSRGEGAAVETLHLAAKQHGRVLRGSVSVSSAAAGGTLAVELRSSRTAVGGHGNGTVRVGELRHAIAGAGRLPFAVHLRPVAQQALTRRGHLSLIVNTIVKPPSGTATTLTRRVKLSA
jgi:plastocyanin